MILIKTYSSPQLAAYVKSFWYLQVAEGLDFPYSEVLLPDGHQEIIFHLNSNPVRKKMDSDRWIADPPVFFSGQNRKSYIQQLEPGAVIYGIRFHPHTQSLFYQFPASLSTDQQIPLDEMVSCDTITACIDESPAKTFYRLEQEFLRRIQRLQQPANTFLYVDAAVRRILSDKGNIKNELLEKITGVSSRHLEKSFQKIVGLSPKQFSNIIRYNYFITYKKNNPEKTFTHCAQEAAFHDQAHLIHLSRFITGHSPKTYFNRPNPINDFFLEN